MPSAAWLSLDLSHLAVQIDAAAAADRLETIAAALSPGRRIQIGAEDAAHTDAILGCVLEVAGRGLRDRLGATVQANLLRSPADARALVDAGVHVRLVKGAYVERTGAHPFGEPTDIAYLRLGAQLARDGANWSMATHDGRMREGLLLADPGVVVEQLFGVRHRRARGAARPRRQDPGLRALRPRLVSLLGAPRGRVPRRLSRGARASNSSTILPSLPPAANRS